MHLRHQRVEDAHVVSARDQRIDQMRSDEPRPARDQNPHAHRLPTSDSSAYVIARTSGHGTALDTACPPSGMPRRITPCRRRRPPGVDAVLSRLALDGGERVIDAGCGSGRLTAALLDRLPHGRVLALDRSRNMLEVARVNLRPAYAGRVQFVQAALPLVPVTGWADVVFSTATFHWIRDHQVLFARSARALRPGGRLHAQCGGGPNLAHAHALAETVMAGAAASHRYFAGWPGVWEFASAEVTATGCAPRGFVRRGHRAGRGADDAGHRNRLPRVCHHGDLPPAPGAAARGAAAALHRRGHGARAAAESPAFTLDYWRLNMTRDAAGGLSRVSAGSPAARTGAPRAR